MADAALRLAFVVAVAAAATGLVAPHSTATTNAARTATTAPASAPTTAPTATWTIPVTQPRAPARPVRVRIPAIGVDSAIIDITINKAGQLIPPDTTDVVGWYLGGPAPGDTGPALLAAHVDSHLGPGVFYRLVELRAGDLVTVDRADHTSVRFRVASLARVPKSDFPTNGVYAPEPVPQLRLITCGGAFDRSARSYRDNIIVDADAYP